MRIVPSLATAPTLPFRSDTVAIGAAAVVIRATAVVWTGATFAAVMVGLDEAWLAEPGLNKAGSTTIIRKIANNSTPRIIKSGFGSVYPLRTWGVCSWGVW